MPWTHIIIHVELAVKLYGFNVLQMSMSVEE